MQRIFTEISEIGSKTPDTPMNLNNMFLSLPDQSKYKLQWARYYERASQKEVDEKIRIEPYLGQDVLLYHTGYRSIMDIVGGICVSVGVLGTFIGLSVGLADLNTENPDQIRSGITVLIGGMRVAFYTSVAGVVFSLLWMFYDRMISRKLEDQLDKHTERLDFLLNTDDEELFLNRLEKITRTQNDHLKTVLTDALERVMSPVVTHLHQSNQLMEKQIQQQQASSTDITTRIIDEVTGGTQETLQQFGDLIQNTHQMQSGMMNTMEQVMTGFHESEKKQTETAEQTQRMFAVVERMIGEMEHAQSHYSATSANMSELSKTIQMLQQQSLDQMPLQQSVLENNQQLAEKYERISADFASFQKSMDDGHTILLENLVQFTSKLTNQYEQMTSQFGKSLDTQVQALRDSEIMLRQLQELSREVTPQMNAIIDNMGELSHGLREMQVIQSELLPEMSKMNMHTQESVTQTLAASKSYAEQMEQQSRLLKEQWEHSGEQFTKTRESLDLSLRNFADNIDSGLTKTYQHFDETLKNAVKGVAELVEELSDHHEDLIDEFGKLTENIVKTRKEVNVQ
ncbi:MotA/TolQ/ExbB proton channel family protein [Paenibacillus chungangensis]|uniref:MotA/TolQ/ExbB proton channel family protein n=1 Tax=Paenibacillus chungangensis TaxID=696535 RepID=A0ABW3HSP6_9BACL